MLLLVEDRRAKESHDDMRDFGDAGRDGNDIVLSEDN